MLNQAVNRVANGRRMAARRIVMNTLATIPAQVWRKSITYSNQYDSTEPSDPLSFEANAVSQQDEPNYEYDYLGTAYILADHFNSGYIHKNTNLNNPSDLVIQAQIEPYDDSLKTMREQINHIPEMVLKEGDLLGLMVYSDFTLWFEIVGMTGQTLMADFGTKYILNRRDELPLSPIEQ